jgi:hypothetical protein
VCYLKDEEYDLSIYPGRNLSCFSRRLLRSGVCMNKEIEKITDKIKIHEIIQTRFIAGRIFVKTSDINIQVDSYIYENGLISIMLPDYNESIRSVIFYIRDKDEVVISNAVFKHTDDNGKLLFEILDVQTLNVPRKEIRKNIASVDKTEAAVIYISNIISDFTIQESISSSRRRVDIIKDELLKKVLSIYPGTQILFLDDKTNDSRMLYCKTKRKPFFIKNMKDLEDTDKLDNHEELKYYKSYIFNDEPRYQKTRKVSEICVPLLYKLMMPFGYIKSESSTEFNDDDFSVLRKLGMTASTVYTNDKQIIISSDENIAVTDLSMNGLGIFFRDKIFIKHFKEKSLILFSIYLPGGRHATFLCEVRNITLIKNYVYRVGCEIQSIEALGEVYYSEYLAGLA